MVHFLESFFWEAIVVIERNELDNFFNRILKPKEFKDYCPNGLQIEGKKDIKNIAFAVSATLESIDKAIEMRANALVVHHGLFWKHQGSQTLTGPFGRRVMNLVRQQINLFGFHLPLDAHLEIGNAKSLGNLIGLVNTEPFGDYKGCSTGIKGTLSSPTNASDLKGMLKIILKHDVILSTPNPMQEIKSIGIITGGANSDWRLAAEENLDAYITGEISEYDWHESKEAGVHMFAGGHNATETFGIQALQQKVIESFPEVECSFISSLNPA